MGDASRPVTIVELIDRARERFCRVDPDGLAGEMERGALVVDTRPLEQRERDGELPGAVVICRNVLEWRLDPLSSSRLDVATSHDQRIVVVCNEGYSSSLAVASLLDLGLAQATDLTGGFQAWKAWNDEQQNRWSADSETGQRIWASCGGSASRQPQSAKSGRSEPLIRPT